MYHVKKNDLIEGTLSHLRVHMTYREEMLEIRDPRRKSWPVVRMRDLMSFKA